jgi:hypothetical protein
MLDSLSPQERAFDQIVRKVGDSYVVIPERQATYRVVLRNDLRGVSLIQRADPDWFYLNDGKGGFVREPIAGNPRFLDEDGVTLSEEPEDFGLAVLRRQWRRRSRPVRGQRLRGPRPVLDQ